MARPPITTAEVGMNRFISPDALWYAVTTRLAGTSTKLASGAMIGMATVAMNRKMTRLIPRAGPAVQNMFLDVRADREPTAHQLRHQDGRLRQWGHLVAEVRAADHRAGRDRLVQAHDVGHSDERDSERAGGGPGAAGDHADQGADQRGREVEPGRAEPSDSVVHDGQIGRA